ncbi:uncharacterized protein LOC111112521 [Crassostrea virginica]
MGVFLGTWNAMTMNGMALLVCCIWTVLLCVSVQAYENLALHRPTWQSSTVGPYTADLAVDGQYTVLAWYGGQCAVSQDEQTAEWRLDLGAVRSIHHIVIQYATNNRVWGCPSPGYYGENCSLECPQNCQDGYCDILDDCSFGLYGSNCSQNCSMTCGDPGECDMRTGHCNGGCQVGWTGAMCETGFPQECSKGFHGVNCMGNCSLTCGLPGNCNRIAGHCNGGCQRGWTGVMCEKG